MEVRDPCVKPRGVTKYFLGKTLEIFHKILFCISPIQPKKLVKIVRAIFCGSCKIFLFYSNAKMYV
jgi:hypothetical protein